MTKGQDAIAAFLQVMKEQGKWEAKAEFNDIYRVLTEISDETFDEMCKKYYTS